MNMDRILGHGCWETYENKNMPSKWSYYFFFFCSLPHLSVRMDALFALLGAHRACASMRTQHHSARQVRGMDARARALAKPAELANADQLPGAVATVHARQARGAAHAHGAAPPPCPALHAHSAAVHPLSSNAKAKKKIECCSCWGLNPGPVAHKTTALPG